MSGKPQPKAFCIHCRKPRALLTTGHTRPHVSAPYTPCAGSERKAEECPTCRGTRTVLQFLNGDTCRTCYGAGRIVK